jgi:CBS domain-containing protein
LEKLDAANILSAPVINDKNEIMGIVDVLDIVLFVIGSFPKDIRLENLDEKELRKVMKTGSEFDQAEISTVWELSARFKSNYEHVFRVKRTTPVSKLLEMFYEGVHRVIVVDVDGHTALNIISQSDLLSILSQCLPYLDVKERTKPVNQLGLGTQKLASVSTDTKTITVLSKMQPDVDKPIFSSVPIVDSEGRLVATFSASNLKGLRQTNFPSLLLPVLTFLTIQPESKQFLSNLGKFKSLHPIVCSSTSSFETLVEKMVAHKVHRLYVVEDNKPVGVISIGDVFKVFLPWANTST